MYLKGFFTAFILSLGIYPVCSSQEYLRTHIIPVDEGIEMKNGLFAEVIPILLSRNDLHAAADSIRNYFTNQGYLSTSVDTVVVVDSMVFFHVYTGLQYSLGQVEIQPQDQPLLEDSGFLRSQWQSIILTKSRIDELKANVLQHLATKGYPFSSVYFDRIQIEKDRINTVLTIDKGPLITYDTLVIRGNASVRKNFLQNFFLLKEGEPYNQQDILNIRNKVRDLTFLELTQDPQVTFVNEKAHVVLPLQERNASRFDFIIGLLPLTTAGVQRWTITGDFTGEFINKLGSGERFFAQFRRLRPETQNLDIQVNYPYFLNLPLGIDGQFFLFRNTNQFLEIVAEAGVFYTLSGRDHISFGWEVNSSRLIEINSEAILRSGRLPEQLDIRVNSGQLGLVFNRLDDLFNPTHGWSLRFRMSAGQKRIIPNLTILGLSNEEIDFNALYNELNLSTLQLHVRMGFDRFIDVRQWAAIRLANQSAFKWNQDGLFDNEFMRIGGYRLMRGFNEESIFTPYYSIFTAEFRILLDRMSYLSLPFVDYGIFGVRNADGIVTRDHAAGIGLGLNFATQAGLFNIAFATGNRSGRGFDFNDTKIHFGYLSMF